MRHAEPEQDYLSDYERAVCYYTLPKVVSPVTFGLIGAYLACLLEAAALLGFGVATRQPPFTRWGFAAVAGIIVLGLVAFTGRAFMNEVKRRRLLNMAHETPDPSGSALDTPDPFADHVLLQRPFRGKDRAFRCTDNGGKVLYSAETEKHGRWRRVRDPEGNEVFRVRVRTKQKTFFLFAGAPSRLAVYEGADEVARLRRRFSFSGPVYDIECLRPQLKRYTYRNNGIYVGKRLVGRIYDVRRYLYLDIEEAELHHAVLGLFVTMS
ncbi:MAG TPA: hypothetical protein HPP83_04565 [Candidatus Hydrogenedentes bacterium]|nr:hypothetical protein [Candidatus Hydrogenedentota bacterium]